MERIIYLLLIVFAIFLLLCLKKPQDNFEDEDEYDAPPECESCAITSLAPEKVCPTGMCTQKRGRAGCNV